MANPITFAKRNFVLDSDLSILSGTVDAQFPLDNIKLHSTIDEGLIRPATGETTVQIQVDLGEELTIEVLGVAKNQREGFDYNEVNIRHSTTTDFSTDNTITIDVTSNPINILSSSISARYLRFEFDGFTDFATISNILVGSITELGDTTFSRASFSIDRTDNSVVTTNQYGVRFVRTRNTPYMIDGKLELMTQDEWTALRDIWEYHSFNIPVWVFIDRNKRRV